MKKNLYFLLAPLSLVANPCCVPLEDPNCYTYAVNPPLVSEPCCVWGGHFDFLYFKPYAEGNPFAIIETLTLPPFNQVQNTMDITLKEYDYDYKAGFRAGVDVGLPCNEWRVGLDWTHYQHDFYGSQGSVAGTTTQTIVQAPYFNISIGNNLITTDTSLNSQYKIQLDDLDLVLNREFYVGHKVTLRPYGGLRALFLKQKVDSKSEIFTGAIVPDTITSKLMTEFKGVGLVAGLFSSWDVYCGVGVYADFSASLLYGKNKSHLAGNGLMIGSTSTISNSTPTTLNFTFDPNVVRSVLDMGLGLQWSHLIIGDKGLLQIRAGWELHQYNRQVNFANFSLGQIVSSPNANETSNDLSFQGLVISGSFTY